MACPVSDRHAAPPNEFICTVGAFALFDNMYPPDGLCNYLFYAHALVSNGSVLAVEVDASWQQFKAHVKTYTMTQGGISFDARKTMADTVIAISSTGWIENEQNCYSAPTSVLDSMRLQDPARTIAKSYPDLKTHAALVAANVMYNKNTTRLGLSLEMGTLLYVLNATEMNIKKKSYRPCKQFYLTQADTVPVVVVNSFISPKKRRPV
ncbi:uncharacterized protein LOC125947120 [Dermacentor silvarum]|uniref:uncharacterized protein LOC125947120 n=1 Tax=Dermacentor silvarum TaxID=543639 RepID=UPI002101B7B8|nr:uncharacterized protein LOC125947120 [Dermacentor silvarum]